MAFERRVGALWAEQVAIEAIIADVGTPLFIYSASLIREQASAVRTAFEPLGAEVRYAVKANSNLSVLGLLLAEGCGMDVVSGGELLR
ncbi:MAG: diaminopimelate decarboxylase, partial [Planctomycetota bacterium]